MEALDFYDGKKVLITGHTGFKGSWLSKLLIDAGAEVTGYSLQPPTNPNLFSILDLRKSMRSLVGDVRDFTGLSEVFFKFKPDIVFHLAAQPIVRQGYKDPVYTYETNVMGTVNILECVRSSSSVRSFLNVTTDKVYENKEWDWGYREGDALKGYDPYSNSKSCSELVTHSYRSSFFSQGDVAISTARAGNVIGGGDFADDRIVPDCVRAVVSRDDIIIRNPKSVRPYQHVLEPLSAYLLIAAVQYENPCLAGSYNVGPEDCDCVTTGDLVSLFCSSWGDGLSWVNVAEKDAPHEATFLKLDCSRIKKVFGWHPQWHIAEAVEKVCQWTRVYISQGDVAAEMEREISEYFEGAV